ncbi:endolytic transglycosylase MltG [Candidatus Cytomitobacter indipagum]|uniref:endolytic transglycosylase MltG n=1 Tax=Candidatus Cytomitobacter indipagum TaxID=2601575 RepID=UPI00155AF76F|nr:endolytic transglycosylase MltG [Candidatus Cytomitobacter indipagum]
MLFCSILLYPINKIIYIHPNASLKERFCIFNQSIKRPSSKSSLLASLAMMAISSNKIVRLESGEYDSKNIFQFIYHIWSKKIYMRKITIPEGWSSFKICQTLYENQYMAGEIGEIPNDGTISPGTYLYARNINRNQIIQKMQNDFVKMTTEIWSQNEKKYWNNINDWIIFSSIVQKESKSNNEMHRIATIFRNRLDQKMKLDADSTAVYGITKGETHISRVIHDDIKHISPYNTYKFKGLPIGSICNPGKHALIASINPISSKELFFHHREENITVSEKFSDHIDSINRVQKK